MKRNSPKPVSLLRLRSHRSAPTTCSAIAVLSVLVPCALLLLRRAIPRPLKDGPARLNSTDVWPLPCYSGLRRSGSPASQRTPDRRSSPANWPDCEWPNRRIPRPSNSTAVPAFRDVQHHLIWPPPRYKRANTRTPSSGQSKSSPPIRTTCARFEFSQVPLTQNGTTAGLSEPFLDRTGSQCREPVPTGDVPAADKETEDKVRAAAVFDR
jgi:hypothetical protein